MGAPNIEIWNLITYLRHGICVTLIPGMMLQRTATLIAGGYASDRSDREGPRLPATAVAGAWTRRKT